MKIYFGLNLDGYRAPKVEAAFDQLTCGPKGLLQILETRLGLRSLPVSPFRRVLQFRQAVLEAAKQSPVYFRASSKPDSLATARVLLGWRDGLIESGWNGLATQNDPPRLRDLAGLETIVRASVSPGDADRLAAVHQALAVRSPGELRLEVLDCREHLPPLWQAVCDQLHAGYPKPTSSPAGAKPAAAGGTDLLRYQAFLEGKCKGTFKPKNDGSLLVLTAHSEITLARAVAQIIAHRDKNQHLTLIAGAQAGILDQALVAEDEPVVGLQLRSAARPIPQLLLLALRLCWQPINPGALLEFLTHPASPVGKLLRQRLSEALVASPGICGPQWNEAITGAREASSHYGDKAEVQAALKKIDEDLERWVLMERFDPVIGAPGAKLSEFCMELSRWAAARSASPGASEIQTGHFQLLSSIAADLAEVLSGMAHISELELEKLLQELGSAGWEGEVSEPQLGHVTCAHHPQAVIDPAEQIVWWDFSEPSESKPLPWSQTEQRAFEAHGARFMPPEVQAELKVKSWTRPLLAAGKQLVLVCPKQRDGGSLPKHPLFARLLAVTDSNPPRLPTRDLDQELYAQQATAPLTFAPLLHRPLPQPRRWWKLPDGKWLRPRSKQSYSSLEKFISAPFNWVLMYPARLQRGPVTKLKLCPDFALKGTLLHRLLDLLLAASPAQIGWITCHRRDLESWCDRTWPVLLEQEGATLLLPGNLSESLSLLDLAKRALWELLQQLRAAKVTSARTNVGTDEVGFIGGTLFGYIDLLVTNQAGHDAVVDLKLGGGKWRQEELKFNRQLQLAVYGYLQQHSQQSWPEAAYYILGQQRLLTQTDQYFPKATVQKTAVPNIGLENCWKDFEAVWRWRREQLDAGWIENTTTPLPEAADPSQPDSTAPREHWQAEPEAVQYNDFDALTGWRADQ